MTITGTNFGSSQGSGTVSFNGTAASVTSWAATSIAVTVPTGATTGNVVVFANGVNSNGSSFTVVAAPSITSLSITAGADGAAVTITGTNFGSSQGSGTVSFNGTAASVTSWAATSIAVTVPTGATTGNVVVFASGVNSNGSSFTVLSPLTITPTSGPVSTLVELDGTNFGATQGTSTVSLNGTSAPVKAWSSTTIVVGVPSGASTGPFSVTVNGQADNSSPFTVTALPSGWADTDVGSVGIAGSAAYSNGIFTVTGAGAGASGTADALNFAYQPLSGDGTIVARVASFSGSSGEAGVMIRETLNSNATDAVGMYIYSAGYFFFYDRPSTGASVANNGQSSGQEQPPYWAKLVRSGNTFSAYTSLNGLYWTQLGTTQTITMAQNAYVGLFVSSGTTGATSTATFDNVSVSSTATPAPVITSLSATSGSVGSQVVISGSGFGATEGGSLVTLNGVPVTVNTWSSTSIVITIPTGATTGLFGPRFRGSEHEQQQPRDVRGDYTAAADAVARSRYRFFQRSGECDLREWDIHSKRGRTRRGVTGTADAMHFVYQPLRRGMARSWPA